MANIDQRDEMDEHYNGEERDGGDVAESDRSTDVDTDETEEADAYASDGEYDDYDDTPVMAAAMRAAELSAGRVTLQKPESPLSLIHI